MLTQSITMPGGLDVVLIESLDLDTKKEPVSKVEKVEIKIYQDLPKISITSRFLDLDQEVAWIFMNLNQDYYLLLIHFSNRHFSNRHLWKVWIHRCLIVKALKKYWEILINLDDLDKNLNAAKSQLKSLDFKNLNQEKIKTGLGSKDNPDGFQKLVLTLRTISILIGLDCWDPQAYQ